MKVKTCIHLGCKVGQSAQEAEAGYPSTGSSQVSLQGQSILRNQGGVMDHDHVLRIPFDGSAAFRPVEIPIAITMESYLTATGCTFIASRKGETVSA